MNFAYRLLLPGLLLALMTASSHAQEAVGEDAEKRVQYQLVLPEEKTPENVKPEEHNPFESESEALSRQSTGDTEENRVRDKLLKLPVVGVNRDPDGRMRVMLGDIILETGHDVPPVLEGQLVVLKVKNINSQQIELAWQEKRLTGLPPKLMTIPINLSPKVRYQMFGQTETEAKESKGVNATMELSLRDQSANPGSNPAQPGALPPAPQSTPASMLAADPAPPRAQVVADDPQPFTPPRLVDPPVPVPSLAQSPPSPSQGLAKTAEKPQEPTPAPAPATPPSPAVESVVHMLFGNPTPAPR